MTQPRPETLEREKDKIYLTDREIVRRLGVPEADGMRTLKLLEDKHGFPRKQPLFGGRRYWPAVQAYFDRLERVNAEAPPRWPVPRRRTPND